jgi:hypothetical protein
MDQASGRGPARNANGRFGPGAAVRAALERVEAGEGSLADIEAALAGLGPGEEAP